MNDLYLGILCLVLAAAIIIGLCVFLNKRGGITLTDVKDSIKYDINLSAESAKSAAAAKQWAKNNGKKDKSVVGSAVVGSLIAGPVGGVVGAIYAADKNNRETKK